MRKILFAFVVAIGLTPMPTSAETVAEAVAYLNDIEEVFGVKIVYGNHVWIAFKYRPDDAGMILRAAAFNANIKSGFGAHVYLSTPERLKDAPNAPVICSVSTRYGKVSKSSCNF